jgi:hypothetical protein
LKGPAGFRESGSIRHLFLIEPLSLESGASRARLT